MQAVVEMRLPGFRQHPRRKVDALDDRGAALERPRGKAGAAAEIERAAEAEGATAQGAGAAQRRGDQLRAAVVQVPDEVLVEARRVVVEERPDIARRNGLLGRQRAETGEVEADAERILGLDRHSAPQGGDRRVTLAEREARPSEERVSGRESRHELQHLRGQIGCGLMVALGERRLGMTEAAVGEEVAGGAEERGHASGLLPAGIAGSSRP